MISIKMQHDHLPCHPSKGRLKAHEKINETDREHFSDSDDNEYESSQTPYEDLRSADDRTILTETESRMGSILGVKYKKSSPSVEKIYNTNVIENNYQKAVDLIPLNVRNLIQQKQKLIEDKIYHSLSDKGNQVLQRMYKEIDEENPLKDQIKQSLIEMMANVHEKVEDEIQMSEYRIHSIIRAKKADILKTKKERKTQKLREEINLKKSQLEIKLQHEKSQKQKSSKQQKTQNKQISQQFQKSQKQQNFSPQYISQNQRRPENQQKLQKDYRSQKQQRSQQQQRQIYRQAFDFRSDQGLPSADDFHFNSSKTKKAEEFIKRIKRAKAIENRKKQQRDEKKKNLEVRSMEERREFEKQMREEKKNYLRRKLQAKQEGKAKEIQIREKMNQQYKQFLAKHKKSKPLFKRKEKQFQKELKQEERIKANILQRIKQHHRPISYHEIKNHQDRYLEQRSSSQKQKAQVQRIEAQRAQIIKYQKSRFHQVLVQQEIKQKERKIREDPQLIRSELIKKRDIYSKQVRQKFFPKIDEAKHRELEELMAKLRWAEKLKSGKTDDLMYRAEGLKNLKRVHELIGQLRKEGKVLHQSQTIDIPSTKPVYKDYLEQLQQITENSRYSIDYQRMVDDSPKGTRNKALEHEQKAKRREMYLHAGTLNIDKTLKEKKRIDDEYLESMKAKMALLNKLNG